jgi:hypothetical protein
MCQKAQCQSRSLTFFPKIALRKCINNKVRALEAVGHAYNYIALILLLFPILYIPVSAPACLIETCLLAPAPLAIRKP